MALTARDRVRAQAKELTRKALLQAGLEEAMERGGVGTPSIEDICARAGYTRGAFYVHFEDRADFVVAMMDWVMTDIVGALFGAADSGESPIEEIVARFTTALTRSDWPDVANVRAGYLGVMEAVQRSERVRERHAEFMKGAIRRLEEAIREAQNRRKIRGDVRAHELADLTILLAIGGIMWDRIGIPIDMPAIGESLLKLMSGSSPAAPKKPSPRPKAQGKAAASKPRKAKDRRRTRK